MVKTLSFITFSVCALSLTEGALNAFFPDGKLKKVFRYICGLIILVCMTEPLFVLLTAENDIDLAPPPVNAASEENDLAAETLDKAIKAYICDFFGIEGDEVQVKSEISDGEIERVYVYLSGKSASLSERIEKELGVVLKCELIVTPDKK